MKSKIRLSNSVSLQKSFHPRRSGAATVEAAIILPILVIVSLGSVDVAQYINVSQTVCNASREGARIASRDDTDKVSQVQLAVREYVQDTFPNESPSALDQALLIHVTDESGSPIPEGDLSKLESGKPVSVRVVMDFSKVRWIQWVNYWNGEINESTSVGRRE